MQPSTSEAGPMQNELPLLALREVTKTYVAESRRAQASTARLLMNPFRVVATKTQAPLAGGKTVLDKASLEIRPGQRVAILGDRQSGKSTLAKLVSGLLYPDSGTIERRGRHVTVNQVGKTFKPMLTLRENLDFTLALYDQKADDRTIAEILAFSGATGLEDRLLYDIDVTLIKKTAFACLLALDADLYVFDSLYALGDPEFKERCLVRLGEVLRGKAALLIGSRLDVLQPLAERILYLGDAKLLEVGQNRLSELALSISTEGFSDFDDDDDDDEAAGELDMGSGEDDSQREHRFESHFQKEFARAEKQKSLALQQEHRLAREQLGMLKRELRHPQNDFPAKFQDMDRYVQLTKVRIDGEEGSYRFISLLPRPGQTLRFSVEFLVKTPFDATSFTVGIFALNTVEPLAVRRYTLASSLTPGLSRLEFDWMVPGVITSFYGLRLDFYDGPTKVFKGGLKLSGFSTVLSGTKLKAKGTLDLGESPSTLHPGGPTPPPVAFGKESGLIEA